MSFFDMNSYPWYASLRGLSQNTIVPSLAISTPCLLGYVSSTSSASTMQEYCFAFFGHIDTLPLGLLCLLGYFASWAALPLGLLCLLGYFASWATLPLGLLCLLGFFASWATFASWALYRHFASQAMSHRYCLLWQCRYTNMPLGLCHHRALVSMSTDKLCQYVKPEYYVRPDMIRDMIFVSFEIAISIY
jgi:uncharacterized membrane protein YphA (DoxX/SURF4 family)